MQQWLIAVTVHYPYLVYGVILVVTCVEGPITSMLCGLLYKLGFFSLIPLFSALVLGDLLGDSVWYVIGYHFGMPFTARFGKYVGITREKIENVEKIFHRHKEKVLILSKLTNGLGLSLVILLTAGMVKLPFWKYLSLNAIGEIMWTGALVAIGYFFGDWYIQINSWMGRIGIVAVFIFIVILFIQWKKYFRAKIDRPIEINP